MFIHFTVEFIEVSKVEENYTIIFWILDWRWNSRYILSPRIMEASKLPSRILIERTLSWRDSFSTSMIVEEVSIFCTYMISLRPGMYFDIYTHVNIPLTWILYGRSNFHFVDFIGFMKSCLLKGAKKHMGKAETSINRFALSIDTQHRHTAPTVYRGHLFQAIICFLCVIHIGFPACTSLYSHVFSPSL